MKLLPLAESFDVSGVSVPDGWTQKDIKDVVREAQERMQFLLKSRINALDLAIENFSRVKFAVASLPAWADSVPYFDFVNNKMQSQMDTSEDVKLRSRMEWENSVKTRTGNRRLKPTPGPAAGVALSGSVMITTPAMSVIQEGNTEKRKQRTTATKRKAEEFAAPSAIVTTTKRSTRNQRAAQPAISSTPIHQPAGEQTLFAVPTTRGRATRSRKVVSSRLNTARALLPDDKLVSANGSPIQNPFNLHYARNSQKPSQKELEHYYQLVGAVSGYLKDVVG